MSTVSRIDHPEGAPNSDQHLHFKIDEERCQIVDRIKSNGGEYTGSLDRTVTHLIVYEPAGKKYMAAKRWGLHIVALQWLQDSIERGMILDEAFYDPLLPQEDIGKGAWTKREFRPKPRAKRQRDPAASVHNTRRKLRKTASMKLNSQRENMWGEILGQQPSAGETVSCRTEEPTQPLPNESILRPSTKSVPYADNTTNPFAAPGASDGNLFTSCHFCIFNFQADRVAVLAEYILSRGGRIFDTIPPGAQDAATRRFLIVPQDSSPFTHPQVPDGVEIVTQFFIERCVHGKRLLRPQDHVFGRPFPVFPIEGFHDLSISTGGFVDLDLSQVERTIRQLGARYEERFTVQCSVLVCNSLATIRKAKLDIALIWNVPVVKAEWLWQCISQGRKLAIDDFFFPELEARRTTYTKPSHTRTLNKSRSIADVRRNMETTRPIGRRVQSTRVSLPGPDMTAFDRTSIAITEPSGPAPGLRRDSGIRSESGYTDFDTAQTHHTGRETNTQQAPARPESSKGPLALTEKSASDLNKASPKAHSWNEDRKPLTRVRSEICDSEAGDGDSSALVDVDDTGSFSDAKAEDATEAEKHHQEWGTGQKDAEERRALSHKLTSLLENAGARTGNDGTETRAANAHAGTSHGELQPILPASRRKRDIMGRAISNVSAASTESQDSTSGGRALSRTHSAAIHRDDSPSEEELETKAPTTTQVQYDDPDATMSKARLMSKMLGRSSMGTGDSHKAATEDRVTMGDLCLQQNGAGGRLTGGRSMRRRQ